MNEWFMYGWWVESGQVGGSAHAEYGGLQLLRGEHVVTLVTTRSAADERPGNSNNSNNSEQVRTWLVTAATSTFTLLIFSSMTCFKISSARSSASDRVRSSRYLSCSVACAPSEPAPIALALYWK